MMRKRSIIIFLAALFAAPVLYAQEQAVIKTTTGKVAIQRPGKSWEAAEPGTEIFSGTKISTGFNSSMILDLGGTELTVQALTRMELKELIRQETEARTKLYLNVGKVLARIKTVEGLTHDFELRSRVSVSSVRGTDFEYDGRSLTVLSGKVMFFNSLGQRRTVRQGEASATTGYDPPETGEGFKNDDFNVSIYTNENVEEGGVTGGSVVDIEYVDLDITVD